MCFWPPLRCVRRLCFIQIFAFSPLPEAKGTYVYLSSAEDSHLLTRPRGRCSETHGRRRASRCLCPATRFSSWNNAEKTDGSPQKYAKTISVIFGLRSILRSLEVIKGQNWRIAPDWEMPFGMATGESVAACSRLLGFGA